MPVEVDKDTFLKLAAETGSCRVKRLEKTVKLKIKTSQRLYTYKVEKSEGEELLNKLKCKIVEV